MHVLAAACLRGSCVRTAEGEEGQLGGDHPEHRMSTDTIRKGAWPAGDGRQSQEGPVWGMTPELPSRRQENTVRPELSYLSGRVYCICCGHTEISFAF